MIRWSNWFLVALFTTLGLSAHAQPKAQTQARLLLSHDTAKPGETITAGLQFKMPPEWHIYWQNSGDSGYPPSIKEWTLPAGIKAGVIEWPVPQKARYKTPDSDLTTIEYHDEVILLFPLHIAAEVPKGKVDLKAALKWLECETRSVCVPGSALVSASLTIGDASKPSADAPLLEAARGRLPHTNETFNATAFWEGPAGTNGRPLIVEWDLKDSLPVVDFYPFPDGAFKYEGLTEVVSKGGGKARIRLTAHDDEGKWPQRIAGLLIQNSSEKPPAQAYAASMDIKDAGKASAPGAVPTSKATTPQSDQGSLAWNLLLAFFGGMILNIMPCVFPVIALKILGFVNQSKSDPGQVFKLGLIYSLGVVASFLVFAGMIIAVKNAGNAASWGMQMQNAHFTLFLTVLVVLVALNLFGLFEITLGGRALDSASELAGKEGATGAFFNGIFTTILATPCTAPLLANAMGFAFAQPAGTILLMFVVAALGLAAPYLVLSWKPGWLRFLPRPGAWMEKFKIAMGFPMLATAIWLFSFTAPRYGEDGTLYLGLFVVLVALAAWIWGEFVQRGSKRRPLAMAMAIAFLLFGYFYALEGALHWRTPAGKAKSGGPVQHGADGIVWEPWNPEAIEKARQAGHPVLVDFTADWCLTCKLNKKAAIEVASVRAKIKELKVTALIGDFTDQDPAMGKEIARYSSGVPLVLVYPKDPAKPPIVLPTSLAPPTTFNGAQIVMDALEQAAK